MRASHALRLAHGLDFLAVTLHNGPGFRIALWTQGCRTRCTTQCLNPLFLPEDRGFVFPVDEIVAAVERVVERAVNTVEGVTILGGEPTDQLGPLVGLLAALGRRGLGTMVYTGRTREELAALPDPGEAALLGVTDLLKSGPFVPELRDPALAWRGSSNQRLECLSDRYTPEILARAFEAQRKAFSIRIGPDGRVTVSGLQSRPAAARIERLLRR